MLITIPVEIIALDDNSYHLFIEGFINGQHCDFIIDTGASKSVFALNYVSDILDEVPVAQPELQSAGIDAAALDSHLGLIRNFKLGQLELNNMMVVLIDLTPIDQLYKSFCGKSIWGLIGSDFLVRYKARLDYGRKTLGLHIPKSSFIAG